jgi:hypothetical protein
MTLSFINASGATLDGQEHDIDGCGRGATRVLAFCLAKGLVVKASSVPGPAVHQPGARAHQIGVVVFCPSRPYRTQPAGRATAMAMARRNSTEARRDRARGLTSSADRFRGLAVALVGTRKGISARGRRFMKPPVASSKIQLQAPPDTALSPFHESR